MNCPPEASGCWYCMTDFNSPLGWYSSCEFDCVLHVECLEYEHNENRGKDYYFNKDRTEMDHAELDIFLREFGYELP